MRSAVASKVRANISPRSSARRNDAPDPPRHLEDELGIDLVVHRRLAVEHLRTGRLEHLTCPPAPLDSDHRIERPVPDRDGRERRRGVELETLNRWDERAEHGE